VPELPDVTVHADARRPRIAGQAVHGRFGQPCPVCGAAARRNVYAERKTNDCPRAPDRRPPPRRPSLSRLLREDWPRTLEELEGDRG
jgi:formamidopyrimidine-DNA glycosylase